MDFICNSENLLDEKYFKFLSNEKNIIFQLYMYYLKRDYISINTYEDIEDLIIEYNNEFYKQEKLLEEEIE